MREPEIRGDIVDWGMVYYSGNTGMIRLADADASYEPREWDDLLAQLRAAIRYARKVAMGYATSLDEREFSEENVTLYGRLMELIDRDVDEEGGKRFAGELLRDNGEKWRVRFRHMHREKASTAWGKPVVLTGSATYYRVNRPKIEVDGFDLDVERDYEAAFDALYGCDRDIFDAPLEQLLSEI